MHRLCFSLLRYILQPLLPDLTPPTITKPKSSGSETGYRNVDIASIAVLPVNSKGIRIPLIHHCVMLHFSYFITKFISHFPTKQLQITRMLCPTSTSNLIHKMWCMEEVNTRRHKQINLAGPDRLSSGRNLSLGLFMYLISLYNSFMVNTYIWHDRLAKLTTDN